MERIERLKEMLQNDATDNFLLHALALENIKAGDETTARNIFESILTRDPDYVGSYYHLAQLLERAGETEAAIRWYEQGMAAAKRSGENHAYSELKAAYEELVY